MTTFLEAFRATAARLPDYTAIFSAAGALTYREIDTRSTALARELLRQVGRGPEPVTIMCAHDTWAAVAFVAVAKSGRPAVFLDTTTPAARMRQVASQAGAIATIVATEYRALAAEVGDATGVLVDAAASQSAATRSTAIDPIPPDPDRVLAIVFTSGSTGIPKGVILADGPLCDEFLRMDIMGSGDERIGIPQPLSFIAGLSALVRTMLIGAQLYMYDPRRQGIEGMVDWVQDSQLTTLNVTPHGMRSLAGAANARGVVFDILRTVTCGGEALLVSDVVAMRRCTTEHCVIINASGSSEGWGVSYLSIDRDYPLPATGQVPAGTAFDDRELYLEDEAGNRITEPDQTGMIVVAARNMAAGYWHNPELTAQRFSTNSAGLRVYRTGDLGRWNARGELEYAGRADHMIKIRGYLVEPAEIESQLMASGEIKEAVVVGVPGRDGLPRLVGYVVPEPSHWVSAAALRRRLITTLPAYMVPPVLVELDVLPRNPNGKVDRLVLPEPPAPAAAPARESWNSVEIAIGGICAAALGLEDLGRNDDLLELGADSLAIEEILAGLESECGIQLTSAALMETPTIAAIAARPRRASELTAGVLVPLRAGTARHPLFCVAGAAGMAIAFRSLVRQLPAELPVYGLQAYGLEGSGLADITVKATARRYVAAIRKVQPQGPYHIVGHSLGGLLAYEMAHLLRAWHETVALLGLIDTFSSEGALAPDRVERIQPEGAAAFTDDPGQGHSLTGAARQFLWDHRPYLLRRYWVGRRENRYVLYWTIGGKMARAYRFTHGPLDVPVAIYQAEDNPLSAEHWDRYFRDAPTVHNVPGDHLSMLREPFVSKLAAAMTSDLVAVAAAQRQPTVSD